MRFLLVLALLLIAAAPTHASRSVNPWDAVRGDAHVRVSDGSGGVLVGGSWFDDGSMERRGLLRLDAVTLGHDPAFTPDVTFGTGGAATPGEVNAIAVQTNGQIVIGGRFDHVNGQPRHNIARRGPGPAGPTLLCGLEPPRGSGPRLFRLLVAARRLAAAGHCQGAFRAGQYRARQRPRTPVRLPPKPLLPRVPGPAIGRVSAGFCRVGRQCTGAGTSLSPELFPPPPTNPTSERMTSRSCN